MEINEILDHVLKLKPQEKFLLVESILNSLDSPNKTLDNIWEIEAEKRLLAYRTGKITDNPLATQPPAPELIFENALKAFLEREGHHLLTDISERSTCGRLAHFIELQLEQENLSDYYADIEYNRKCGKVKTIINNELQTVQITADLIVHSRGKHATDNIIAVEVKKASRPAQEKQDDIARLMAMTKSYDIQIVENANSEHAYNYSVGIFMEICTKPQEVKLEFFKQGQRTAEKIFPISTKKAT